MGNGLFAILSINFLLFAGSNLLHMPALASLTLNHWQPQWWQFVTATFMHANWQHLSSNAFALLVFGRMVEEEEGALGVWLTYLLAGVGGTLASYLTSPHTPTISLGASGAVFGLFMVSLIAKFKPSLKRLLEFVILGQFVVQQVLSEFQMVASSTSMRVGGMQVGHIAHLAGAAAGVLLVLLLSRLPDPAEGEDRVVAARLKWPVAGQPCYLFAVFDGHGGSAASRSCAAHAAAIVDVLLSPAAGAPATRPEDLALQLQQAAVHACLELQRAFAASGRSGGCTATLVLQAGRIVTVASLGSSRCVLNTGSGGLATLSAQHVISANQQELHRLLKAGCHVAPQEPGSTGPTASPRSGGGVLRLWPGGLTLSRSIGDFGVGEAVLALPHVKQVLLPPSGGRLVVASDGVWSQAGDRLLHALRRAPIRSAAMEVVRVSSGSGGGVDASVVVADVLEPVDTWQALLQRHHGAGGADAAKPKGAAAGQRTLGLLRKLSLGRSRQHLSGVAEGGDAPAQAAGLVQAELLADYDTAALAGLLPSSSQPQTPVGQGSLSRSSSSSGGNLSSAFWAVGSSSFTSGSSRRSDSSKSGFEDAPLQLERDGCRLRPAWWDDTMGQLARDMLADARALWSAKTRSKLRSAPVTPTTAEMQQPMKQWGGRVQDASWLQAAVAAAMAVPN
ncbi:Rhomboid protease [Chlorella sorokiniana]|uniref:protein-serine/threonine phosphatase n=1 Tax=Chlorella sorokiniana TaxID=3076 RepID=A0A2P6TWN6_CHLSO|nr:Rhomboid protease [Chlorella sorokiniana]|eukprot:PRW58478.1 Rhomboid protease [Chlorella sorokiniana]